MAYERLGEGALDYFPCRYGESRLVFRGPPCDPAAAQVLVIGGSETFGRFMEEPYPALLEAMLGRRVANLGCLHAGLEAYERDPAVADLCRRAETLVVELTGAQLMSNPFYRVHPRRNDRFVSAGELMRQVFASVDLADVHFVGHLLGLLSERAPRRFDLLRQEMRREWVARMKAFLAGLTGRVVLVWMADRAPEAAPDGLPGWRGPGFVTRQMLDALDAEIVEVVGDQEEIEAGLERMIYPLHAEPAARSMLGPVVHQEVARRLAGILG